VRSRIRHSNKTYGQFLVGLAFRGFVLILSGLKSEQTQPFVYFLQRKQGLYQWPCVLHTPKKYHQFMTTISNLNILFEIFYRSKKF